MILKIFLLTAILNITNSFRTNTGFVDRNFKLARLLDEMKKFMPVSLLLNSIEQYLINSKELSYELESCFLNLHGDVHFGLKDDFAVHQKSCLNNFLNYYSFYQILKQMVTRFFADTCPDEQLKNCSHFLDKFKDHEAEIDTLVQDFIKMLIETDQTMKTLEKSFNMIKPANVKRVVMNTIVILNKENFYTQLEEVLNTKNQEIAMEEVTGQTTKVTEKKETKRITSFQFNNDVKDDPFLNPQRYFLEDKEAFPLDDLHMVFTSENNDSELVK